MPPRSSTQQRGVFMRHMVAHGCDIDIHALHRRMVELTMLCALTQVELTLKDVSLIFSDVREEFSDFSRAQTQLQRWKDSYPQVPVLCTMSEGGELQEESLSAACV